MVGFDSRMSCTAVGLYCHCITVTWLTMHIDCLLLLLINTSVLWWMRFLFVLDFVCDIWLIVYLVQCCKYCLISVFVVTSASSDFMVLCKCLKQIILTSLCLVEGLACWDWPLYLVSWLQLVSFSAWHCWLGHLTRKIVPNMTYNVFGGTLNYTLLLLLLLLFLLSIK